MEQVEKFKKKQAVAQELQLKRKPVFTVLNMKTVLSEINKLKKVETKPKMRFKVTPTKVKDAVLPTIFEHTNLKSADGSIERFIYECHPDIRTVIAKHEIAQVTAAAGELTIVTKTRLRIVVTVVGKFQRRIAMYMPRHKRPIMNEVTTVTIKEEKVAA